jgi:chromosome segregation ATPase
MMKTAGVLLIGIVVGAIWGGAYFYNKFDDARGELTAAKSEVMSVSSALRERDEQLRKAKADLAASGDSVKEAVAARQSVEASAKSEAESASMALRERDEQLRKANADLAASENALKEAVKARASAEASLKQALAAKDTAEGMAKQAQEEKATAERASAEARKSAPQ